MSRIRKAYETQFRWLLQHVHARRLDQGVKSLLDKSQRLSIQEGVSRSEALAVVYEDLAARPHFRDLKPATGCDRFFCDAGLGGLARWLRAAGYEASWVEGIDDDELLREARKLGTAILTTDSMLMERRVLRDRLIPALWLPPTLVMAEQLKLVFREFDLRLRRPRCMTCGGKLVRAEKEPLRARIPPRTYVWIDEYFLCSHCDKLFWHGTHWRKIVVILESLKR
jgi:uncharacterized protein with PIN domain